MNTNPEEWATSLHTHEIPRLSREEKKYVWTVTDLDPFEELILSWNGERPLSGSYLFQTRLLIDGLWSPWLLYAVWEASLQYSFHEKTTLAPVRSFQDQVELLHGHKAAGFSIKVEAMGKADLSQLYRLYACITDFTSLKLIKPKWAPPSVGYGPLPVLPLSQMALLHPRRLHLCSPASTTAVIRTLAQTLAIDPLSFSKAVYDAAFDIYGNWSFSIAQASVELGKNWHCFAARTRNITSLWKSLERGFSVVASVKGDLPGARASYANGHLLVIRGYDALNKNFLCMDPAFSLDKETLVAYPWEAFIRAWGNRYYLGYYFFPA